MRLSGSFFFQTYKVDIKCLNKQFVMKMHNEDEIFIALFDYQMLGIRKQQTIDIFERFFDSKHLKFRVEDRLETTSSSYLTLSFQIIGYHGVVMKELWLTLKGISILEIDNVSQLDDCERAFKSLSV